MVFTVIPFRHAAPSALLQSNGEIKRTVNVGATRWPVLRKVVPPFRSRRTPAGLAVCGRLFTRSPLLRGDFWPASKWTPVVCATAG